MSCRTTYEAPAAASPVFARGRGDAGAAPALIRAGDVDGVGEADRVGEADGVGDMDDVAAGIAAPGGVAVPEGAGAALAEALGDGLTEAVWMPPPEAGVAAALGAPPGAASA